MTAPLPMADRCFGITNIKTHIPLILDLDEHNYDAWRELFLTHCLTFDVLRHVDGMSTPDGDNDQQWLKRDGLVKLWIYGTLTPPLFKSSFKTGGTARDVWIRIENQFRSKKEVRAMQIDNEIRNLEIGDQSTLVYAQRLKSLADLLSNLEAPVNERSLVMYMLNGLNEKFDNIINAIKHQKPFPLFDDAKSMLLDEESRLKRFNKPNPQSTDHASSPTALLTDSSPSTQHSQHRNNSRGR